MNHRHALAARTRPFASAGGLALFLLLSVPSFDLCGQATLDPMAYPPVRAFLTGGPGEIHPDAPPETAQFGRLAGIWDTRQELLMSTGEWVDAPPGLWAWKYALGGFAIQDLWFQAADRLPSYMTELDRDYMLTANRIYDTAAAVWRVAWMANSNGQLQGADHGAFEAREMGGDIVMTGPPVEGVGEQRIVFAEISEDSFDWRSEFSRDGGASWITVMRVHATRRHD